jgi:hypothetical protein
MTMAAPATSMVFQARAPRMRACEIRSAEWLLILKQRVIPMNSSRVRFAIFAALAAGQSSWPIRNVT